jgi:hypothetical protein
MTKPRQLRLFKVTSRLVPAGGADPSWSACFVWAKGETAARRAAAEHMAKAKVREVEAIDSWQPGGADFKPGAGGGDGYEPPVKFSIPARRGFE